MVVTKNTIQEQLGILVRNALRLDATVLAFNSTVTAQNWIFLGRPKDHQKTFPVPRIVVEPIDEVRENVTVDNQKQIFVPYIVNAWLDMDAQLDSFKLGDAMGAAVQTIDGTNNIHEIEVIGFSNTSEPTDNRVLNHIVSRVQVDWRE